MQEDYLDHEEVFCFITFDEIEEWLIKDRKLWVNRKRTNTLDYHSPKLVRLDYSLGELEKLPKTAKEAKQSGSTHYFNGTLCRYMHVSPRRVDGVCECCARLHRLKYYQRNKKSLLEHAVHNNRERYHNDPVFKAKRMSRALVERALKVSVKKKDNRTREYLNYSPEDLKEHCLKFITESVFLQTATWHLDHTIPLALFDTEKPHWIACANSLENLRPLSIEEHKVKTALDMTLLSKVKVVCLRILQRSSTMSGSHKTSHQSKNKPNGL